MFTSAQLLLPAKALIPGSCVSILISPFFPFLPAFPQRNMLFHANVCLEYSSYLTWDFTPVS